MSDVDLESVNIPEPCSQSSLIYALLTGCVTWCYLCTWNLSEVEVKAFSSCIHNWSVIDWASISRGYTHISGTTQLVASLCKNYSMVTGTSLAQLFHGHWYISCSNYSCVSRLVMIINLSWPRPPWHRDPKQIILDEHSRKLCQKSYSWLSHAPLNSNSAEPPLKE